MMRVVLDTNTIISGLFWRGIPWQVYSAALNEKYALLTSEAMLSELRDVLSRPRFAPALTKIERTVDGIMAEYREFAESVTPVEIPTDIIRDPKDRIVRACAVGGKADYIVSGDNDLRVLNSYQDIPILSAAQFLERIP